jgi:acyl dehydratase
MVIGYDMTVTIPEVHMADKSKLGMEFPPYSIKVEKNKIAEFAAAVAQKDDIETIRDIYRDEEAARRAGYESIPIPPTFPTSFVFWTGGGLLGTVNGVGADLSRLLHSEEEYEYFAPICAGDILTRKMKVVEMYDRGKKERKGWYAEITVLQTDVINQRGELVMRARTTFIER